MSEIAAYATTRLATIRVFLLVGAIATLGILAGHVVSLGNMAFAGLMAGLLVCQFRLWDDLVDRDYDRERHPGRVLPAVSHVGPFRLMVASASPLVLALLYAGRPLTSIGVYIVLLLAFGALYALAPFTGAQSCPRLIRTHLILAKYPVFGYLCALPPLHARAGALFALGYFVLCVVDLAEDRELRIERWFRAFLATDLAGVVAASLLIYRSEGAPA
jgi:hypothetical protein